MTHQCVRRRIACGRTFYLVLRLRHMHGIAGDYFRNQVLT